MIKAQVKDVLKDEKALNTLYTKKPLFLDKEQKEKLFSEKIKKLGRIFEATDWLIILTSFYFFINFYSFRFHPAFLLINLLALAQSLIYHRIIFPKISDKNPDIALKIDISFYLLMLLLVAQLFGGIGSPLVFIYFMLLAITPFLFPSYFVFVTLFLEFFIIYLSIQLDYSQLNFYNQYSNLFLWEIILLAASALLFFVLGHIYFEQKKEKEKLELSVNFLTADKVKSEAVLESMSDGVFVVDKDKRLIFLNGAAEKMLKITDEQKDRVMNRFYGNVFKFKIGEKNLDYTKDCPLQQAMAEGKPNFRKDLSALTAFKKPVYVTVSAAPIIDATGDAQGAVAIIRDVTKEKEIEKIQMEFVSIASHELLTPITQVQGHLSMIVDESIGKLDETATKLVGNAYQGIKRISRLVKDLLNISRIERGVIKISPMEIDISSFVENTIKDFQAEAESNELSLTFVKSKKDIKVFADQDRLGEILINLLTNALKFTKKGGVKIGVSEKKDGFAVVFVEDTGVGIPKENLQDIFKKFYQVDSSATREAQGTGLGLFISKTIVEMMGGKIWAESKLGQGTTFYFSLPTKPITDEKESLKK